MTGEPRAALDARLILRVIGAGLLIATAAVHLDLYLTGYQTIPTIGWLFLLQLIAGFVLGLAVLATGSRLAAAAGALFALATLGGYLLSVQFGLFGFREVRTPAGIVAGVLEVLAFAALTMLAWMPERGRHAHAAKSWLDVGVTGTQAGAGTAAISVVALALLAAAVAGAGGTASSGSTAANQASAGGGLRTGKVDGTTVLTNAAGKTLYWFAPDSKTKSTCYGSCAVYWPPVTGPLTAPAGLPGTLGTIHRTDGTLQETYNGHPLYTYVGDSKPGQNHGNNVNLNGGFWYQIVVKG